MSAPKIQASGDYLARVLDVMRAGGLVISPTTTNYNLICDATDAAAVERVFTVKRRVKLGPLPVSLPHPDVIGDYVDIPDWFDRSILGAMLPGEISFIFRQKYPFPARLTCGLGTVAVSCTTHPVFRSIVVGLNRPVAATSANLSGQGNIFVPLEKAEEDIGGEVDLIVDAGPTEAQLAGAGDRVNTIVDLTFDRPLLVRPGWVPLDRVLGYLPDLNTDTDVYKTLLDARAQLLLDPAGAES
ncbi:MAG TPA: L-threonylcarbamoyladenylate synthase [Arenibaculum sp.]|nr:L-threonylcarbamoyladenylate synthase [Arenibaculum sp.]